MIPQSAPVSERVRIAFFGRRNVGKSSLVNALAGQAVSLVSEVPGTTADPVAKSAEWLPLGPCVLVDTAGVDDTEERCGEAIGRARSSRAMSEIRAADVVVVVTDARTGIGRHEREVIDAARSRPGPPPQLVVAVNRADETPVSAEAAAQIGRDAGGAPVAAVSAATGEGVAALREKIARLPRPASRERPLFGGRLKPGDAVFLVCPIDGAAPKGRLILPQQLALREALDADAAAIVLQPGQLRRTLARMRTPPVLVVTDSQAFAGVRADVPPDIPLTSFSILLARRSGDWETLRAGAEKIDGLRDGDRVLVAEGCSHRRQCGDIGTEKIPRLMAARTGRRLSFDATSGRGWPGAGELRSYALVLHCGGCMTPPAELSARVADCRAAGVPVANYGVALAKLQGIDLHSLDGF